MKQRLRSLYLLLLGINTWIVAGCGGGVIELEPSSPTPAPDQDQDGYTTTQGDCDDSNAAIHPSAPEVAYDGVDQDCNGLDLTDVDQDGRDAIIAGGQDCDDEEASIFPGAQEVPYDELDQDCSGEDLTDVDLDEHDAIEAGGDDCDDSDSNTYPGATEFADGQDNDCNGLIDDKLDSFDDDRDGYSELEGDCDDEEETTYPGATETAYDGIDQDCSGLDLVDQDLDGQASTAVGGLDCHDLDNTSFAGADDIPYDGIDQDCSGEDLKDVDLDGFDAVVTGGGDCDDHNINIHPEADEVPYDGIDQDCTGSDLIDLDQDGIEGSAVGGADCNDQNPQVRPDLADIPYDGIDQDCSGSDLIDVDEDGFASTSVEGSDCDDEAPEIKPTAAEVCDEQDNNCDGIVDDDAVDATAHYLDSDGDLFGDAAQVVISCAAPAGYVDNDADCHDADSAVYPDAVETCNSIDDDCDEWIDDADPSVSGQSPSYADSDGDGFGDPAVTQLRCQRPEGYVASAGDCNDQAASIHPDADETCNGIDDDCNDLTDDEDPGILGQTTWYADADGDGDGSTGSFVACQRPEGYVATSSDCDDANPSISTSASEVCDGIDNDCDQKIDDADDSITGRSTWYADSDGDGFGASTSTLACAAPVGYVSSSTDCNDTSNSINPNAIEACDGLDNNCNGGIDDSSSCKISALLWGTGGASGITSIASYLMATGKFTKVDTSTATNNTLSTLVNYDAVLFYTNGSSGSDSTNGNVLADYADTGRRLVVCTFSWANQGNNTLSGRLITGQLSPFVLTATTLYKDATISNKDSSSAFVSGVNSITGMYRDAVTLVSGATSYATWSDGYPLIARKGNVVGVNLFPDDSYGGVSGDFKQLFINALVTK
ncbi:MAG: putative metal-binding motif-containing protein [Myxococcota bacterium]